jgi:hypothetical protein
MNNAFLRKMIGEGNLEEVIDLLLDFLIEKHIKLYNELIHQKSRLSQNNKSILQGVITQENSTMTRARINYALVSFINEMDKDGIYCSDVRDIKVSSKNSPAEVLSENSNHKILFLSSNPINATRLRSDKELSEIEAGLQMSKNRDSITLISQFAVTPAILQQTILDKNPTIIHFSGHGTNKGIILEDQLGNHQLVTESSLENLFSLFSDTIKCVVLNSCYSKSQAEAISKHIPYVIGMNTAIPDKTSIAFSIGFYRALGAGKSIDFAYNFGVNNIQLEGMEGDNTPVILKKNP